MLYLKLDMLNRKINKLFFFWIEIVAIVGKNAQNNSYIVP